MNDIYKIKDEWLKNAKVNKEEYEKMYKKSISDNENMKIEKGFGFIKSHSSYVSMFNNWFTNLNNTAGYIYIIRDPRDVAISWAKHANLSYDDSISFMLNFNSCIEWAQTTSELPDDIKPKTFLSSWDEHVLSWTKNNLDVPKLVLKYEDLVYKKEEAIKIIAVSYTHLTLPTKRIV